MEVVILYSAGVTILLHNLRLASHTGNCTIGGSCSVNLVMFGFNGGWVWRKHFIKFFVQVVWFLRVIIYTWVLDLEGDECLVVCVGDGFRYGLIVSISLTWVICVTDWPSMWLFDYPCDWLSVWRNPCDWLSVWLRGYSCGNHLTAWFIYLVMSLWWWHQGVAGSNGSVFRNVSSW